MVVVYSFYGMELTLILPLRLVGKEQGPVGQFSEYWPLSVCTFSTNNIKGKQYTATTTDYW